MNRSYLAVLTLAAITAATAAGSAPMPTKPLVPPTRVSGEHDTLFGARVDDPYRWLEEAKSPEVRAWMAEQDKVARGFLHELPGRDALVKRLRELYYVDSVSAPVRRGDRFFYSRRHADREKAVVYWKEGENGEERVLLDPNTMSKDGSVSLGTWVPSWDGKRVGYAIHRNNADEATLYVKEVGTGKVSDVDVIEGAKYASPQWTPAGDAFYYTYSPPDPNIPISERPGYSEVRFHKLGTDPKSDPIIHEHTGDPKTFLNVNLERDGRWLFVYLARGWNAEDVYYRDLSQKSTEWKPFQVGREALFTVIPWKDHFYIFTNDGAPKYRVFRTETSHPERAHWKEIVPEQKDAVIDGVRIVGGHLSLHLLRNVTSRLEIRTLEGGMVREVLLPGLGTVSGLIGEPNQDDAYFSYSSFTHPQEIFRTSVKNGGSKVWASLKVPVDPKPYTSEQVWFTSKDGTRVPMFIVRRKDLKKDGSTPFILTGYGGFNLSQQPGFSAGRFAWLEAGGAYAIPNLRGGGEFGEEWHKAGMLHNKQHVFDDFIGAAEYLIKEGYTKPERLAISGGSNGGLLVGAAMTQRPDLFRAVICAVPLLDMVRYHLFGSGRTWIPEYGSAEDEPGFKTLFAYSPYHHVHMGTHYPAVLMQSADSDDRVDPMHARKMAALLQASNSGPNPIILRIEKNAGHGGADLVKQQVESSADMYAFLMYELGMTPPH